METIKPGKFVELVYDIYEVAEPQEILMYKFNEDMPESFVYGMNNGMLESFAKAIAGLKAGEAFDVTFGPDDAFGPYMESYLMEFDKEMFTVDGVFDEERVKEGNPIEMMTSDGHRVVGDVVSVSPEKVKIDFNHPLAGQTIHFIGKIKTVRDATPEELQPKSGCCGCDHEHGDEGGCCGDEGGCGSCH